MPSRVAVALPNLLRFVGVLAVEIGQHHLIAPFSHVAWWLAGNLRYTQSSPSCISLTGRTSPCPLPRVSNVAESAVMALCGVLEIPE
jgi:hypothetical protein